MKGRIAELGIGSYGYSNGITDIFYTIYLLVNGGMRSSSPITPCITRRLHPTGSGGPLDSFSVFCAANAPLVPSVSYTSLLGNSEVSSSNHSSFLVEGGLSWIAEGYPSGLYKKNSFSVLPINLAVRFQFSEWYPEPIIHDVPDQFIFRELFPSYPEHRESPRD
ncbi:hypothetical protein AYI69_g8766 [Smittium culicis]|uniref:Uncharacterized protein n=1 Tax=Smittium culicis TaxID=133412 RepID=A0A1R1XH83_9FUNG|nr:hypothetical protein AYI69_g8766 [Smittium culicis]